MANKSTALREMTPQERAENGPSGKGKNYAEGSTFIDSRGIMWYRIHGKWMKLTMAALDEPSIATIEEPSCPTMNCGDDTMYPEGSSYVDIHGKHWKVVNGTWNEVYPINEEVKQRPRKSKSCIPITEFMEGNHG